MGPILNAYPDSMGGTLKDIVNILKKEKFKDTFYDFILVEIIFYLC